MLDLGSAWDPDDAIGPSDWAELADARIEAAGEPVVDVLIPVYGQREYALRAIYSVLAAPQRTPFRVIVCDDASPDETLSSELRHIAQLGLIELVRNDTNLGFPANCNRGFGLHPDRDVVIINSDVLVFNDWLDRLRAHVTGNDAVGTVTPLTSNGTICGYPQIGGANAEPLELSPADLDQLAAEVNAGTAVDAPTGVGFCMYLTRRCLEVTGGFDAEAFGSGYGEENDLCQRAIAAGLRNLLCGDVYVWHRGGVTFGESKQSGEETGAALTESRNPGYLASVRAYVSDDPLKPARRRLDAARIRRGAGSASTATLQVMHTMGGGTERHVDERSAQLRAEGRHSVYCKPANEKAGTFRFYDPDISNTPNLGDLDYRVPLSDLTELLGLLQIDTIHVHQLIGYPPDAAAYFSALADEAELALDVTLHDYTMVCPRVRLLGAGGVYCGEPDEATCQRCIDTLGTPVGPQSIWLWRRSHGELLRTARHVLAPSHDVIQRFNRYFPDVQIEYSPHEEQVRRLVDRSKPPRQPADSISRVGILGAIGPQKGSHVVLRVARAAAAQDVPLEIVVIGYSDVDKALLATGKARITGKYQEEELGQLIYDERIDAIWFPAISPETFSFTLTAALETDLPIVSFDLGAVAERLRAVGLESSLIPLVLQDQPETLLDVLCDVLPATRSA